MRNQHILPNTEVPIELRLGVYKEALKYLKSDSRAIEWTGLCLILPKILYDVKINEYIDITLPGFDFDKTENMFPELKTFLKDGRYDYTNKERIEFLEQTIKKLSNV